ncbi:MAG: NAD-binding protein [Acidobacteria bacterium]|jgi:4-hydroxybutyrate dehydrogenase/sulfolactaldehyde 3-reductase|nr:NAD-binding protein [Acidobacteriota bacterium]MEB2350021.1 NAD(P)-binding domain-containing protein [Burkholderiaceae bacterium]
MNDRVDTIAFIGLGTMGAPMARNLVRAGFRLRVYDVVPSAAAAFAGEAHVADSPADAASGADVVITMLPTGREVAAALFGPGAACATLRTRGLVVDMSTIAHADCVTHGERLRSAGFRAVDAPVGRSPQHAIEGKLLVMAGGDPADVNELRTVFDAIGDTVHHVGPYGSGIRIKLINNYLSMVNMVIAAEGLTFAAKAGIRRDIALSIFAETPAGRGQMFTNYPRKVLAGDLKPDFPLSMGLKDITLALGFGAEVGAPLFLGAASRELFALAKPFGRERDDCTAMLLLLEEIAHARAV